MLDETEVALRNCQLFEGCLARWRDKQIKYLKDSLPCTDPALFERFEQHCLTEPQSWTDLCRLLAVARTDPRYLRVSIQSCLSHQAVTNKAVQSDVSHTETPSDGLITGLSLDFLAHQNPRLSQIVSSTLLFFLGQTKQQDDNTSLRERLEPSFK
jgi:hypothetical protein